MFEVGENSFPNDLTSKASTLLETILSPPYILYTYMYDEWRMTWA